MLIKCTLKSLKSMIKCYIPLTSSVFNVFACYEIEYINIDFIDLYYEM